jgi:hypothetical protein
MMDGDVFGFRHDREGGKRSKIKQKQGKRNGKRAMEMNQTERKKNDERENKVGEMPQKGRSYKTLCNLVPRSSLTNHLLIGSGSPLGYCSTAIQPRIPKLRTLQQPTPLRLLPSSTLPVKQSRQASAAAAAPSQGCPGSAASSLCGLSPPSLTATVCQTRHSHYRRSRASGSR